MDKVDKEYLKKAANRLMFDMSDEEYDRLVSEFDEIKKQMNLISDIDGVDEAIPMSFPFEELNTELREDVVEDCLTQEEVLKNCADTKNGQIKIPRVIK